jgi:hypothetical protein
MRSSTPLTFADWVDVATGGAQPYPYQANLAEHGLPDVLRVPTGTGKTLAATLPWLYRRLRHPDPVVRQTTPHWLVVVLPQRALVEQTVEVIKDWLSKLGLDTPVHVLMGGEDAGDRDWKMHPEKERIFRPGPVTDAAAARPAVSGHSGRLSGVDPPTGARAVEHRTGCGASRGGPAAGVPRRGGGGGPRSGTRRPGGPHRLPAGCAGGYLGGVRVRCRRARRAPPGRSARRAAHHRLEWQP